MTVREYFELLCRTSREGGFPARHSESNACMYRTEDGRRCAIGILIPDERYDRRMEEKTFALLGALEELVEIPEGMTRVDLILTQSCHDCHPCRKWNHNVFVAKLVGLVPAFAGFTDPTGY